MKEKTIAPKSSSITEVAGAGFTWLDMRKPTHKSLEQLKKRIKGLHDEDLEDCLPPFERPKLICREGYLFIVLLYPVYDKVRRQIRPTEVDFFIGKDFLVMSHEGVLPQINRITQRRAVGVTPARLVIELAHDLSIACFPILKDLSNELIEIENRLFTEGNGELIRDTLRIRNNILSFRETMQGHIAVFRKLSQHGDGLFNPEDIKNDCDELIAHIEDIWGFISNNKETAETLYDSHLSLVTMKTNQAMRTLTVLSFLVFPMTLVAAIFSMRMKYMPLEYHPQGFWIVLGIILAVMLTLIVLIRIKKLL